MKKIKHLLCCVAVLSVASFMGCSDTIDPVTDIIDLADIVNTDTNVATDTVAVDSVIADVPIDVTGIDTNMPDIVLSEEQKQAYFRHAQLVNDSTDMTYDDLYAAWHGQKQYLETMPFDAAQSDFLTEMITAYTMDTDALTKLGQNGFVVLENGSSYTHPQLYMDIFYKDLPVFITADSIMYAVHKSYDEMLKQVEENSLIGALDSILDGAGTGLATVCNGATGDMLAACGDIDLYLTVAKSLLKGAPAEPMYSENGDRRDEMLAGVDSLQPKQIQMFGRPYPSSLGKYDFSQFKPRGHYVDSEELQQYFRSMIWLGRTPMHLTLFDRDLLASFVLLKSVQTGNVMDLWEQLDHTIVVFVGKSDNLTPMQFADLIPELGIDDDLSTLSGRAAGVRQVLAEHGIPGSRILSQIMMMNVMSDESTPIAAEFQLLGQRFVIDSYVFSNVVYDRITFDGGKPMRLMPDPLDVAFVLEFAQALPFLKDEIDQWNYAGNLNVLRTMVDEYDDQFWTESMYNAWLGGIRALAIDQTGVGFPAAARTAAWGHRTMQAGLASWAELRHDTILYVKQSYTGEICEYPDGYVEPNPGFFQAMNTFAKQSKVLLETVEFSENDWTMKQAGRWFDRLAYATGMLADIAQAQLDGVSRTPDQTEFIMTTVVADGMCGGPGFSGWYSDLFYNAHTETFNFKPTVADVHTDPNSTDVLHVATGGANPMVVVIDLPSGPRAFVGPVSSFYQFREPGFTRLTDAEWMTRYAGQQGFMPRPIWTDSFISRVDHSGYKNYCEE